jgi:hypothetical protein
VTELGTGATRILDQAGIDEATALLGIAPADLWTVMAVETKGCGFRPDRKVKILFERHVFHKETGGRFSTAANGNISNPKRGGYSSPDFADQYERLAAAMRLDATAALRSTSWGIGQVMGLNADGAGYPDAREMVASMSDSESEQLAAMARFIASEHLDRALRQHDWTAFARGYNGPAFRDGQYDTHLAAEKRRIEVQGVPDLSLRRAQFFLTFLRYDTFGIDGTMGKYTRAAMQAYQGAKGIPETHELDARTLEALEEDFQERIPVS